MWLLQTREKRETSELRSEPCSKEHNHNTKNLQLLSHKTPEMCKYQLILTNYNLQGVKVQKKTH